MAATRKPLANPVRLELPRQLASPNCSPGYTRTDTKLISSWDTWLLPALLSTAAICE